MIKKVGILILIGSFLLTGCKSYTRITRSFTGTADYNKRISEKLKPNSFPRYLLIENADMRMEGDNIVNGRLTFYLEKNKRIFFAAKYLGFEVARGEVTKDSIRFINRIQRKYYFGPVSVLSKYLPSGFDFNTIQTFIYTGFYYDHSGRREFLRDFKQEGDSLKFDMVFDAGQKMTMFYNTEILLDKLYLSDYVHNLLAEISVERENTAPVRFSINTVTGDAVKDFEVKIRDIKHKAYNRTDFKIGKNYTPIERLF